MNPQSKVDRPAGWLLALAIFLRRVGAGGLILLCLSTAFLRSVDAATFRYANSSNRIYIEGGGSATLTDVLAALPNAPLTLVDPVNKVWFLGANLIVADGCTLTVAGGPSGDVNELRLKSDNSSAANSYVYISADWGTLIFNSTKVTSWNEATSAPDDEYVEFQRAYIVAKSRLVGSVAQESTLNVINSDIGHLGYNYREAYGVTWEIVSSVGGVRVFGTVSGSYIHDCQLGVATWSADDVSWNSNEIAFNTLYGFLGSDPAVQQVLATNNVHDNDYGATFRWSSSNQRIYVTGPGSAYLSDIKFALPTVPLTLLDSNNLVWYLGADLYVVNGGHLKLHGPQVGGDVSELRLKSDTTTAAHNFVEIRSDWGWLDLENIKVTSWDAKVNGPNTKTNYGRAFVHARSTLDPDGVTAHESRMDVLNSEVCYLGTHDTEAYGLVWKVVDTTAAYIPPGSNQTIYDLVKVHGDILNSHLHHNFFGMYSYGHAGGHWNNNEADHNIGYGFDPHNYSQNLDIENNLVHDNGWHGIIASIGCSNGIMRSNVVWNSGENGIMLHRSCNGWLVEGNRSFSNKDSGMALFAVSGTTVQNNSFSNNANAGIRLSVGASQNVVSNNDIENSGNYGVYVYLGSDPPEPGYDGRIRNNFFSNNTIHEYGNEAVKLQGGDGNVLIGNAFSSATDTTLRFDTSTDSYLEGNLLPPDVVVKVLGSPSIPGSLFVRDQPLVKLNVDSYSSATFTDSTGAVFDFDEGNLSTYVDASGSMVHLSSAEIGTTTTVVTRNLAVVPNSGGVFVNPTTWNQSGTYSKAWTAAASSGGITVNYLVGDLQPGVAYQISQNGIPQITASADAQGYLSFASVPGSTSSQTYTVSPQ